MNFYDSSMIGTGEDFKNNNLLQQSQILCARRNLCEEVAALDLDTTVEDIKEIFKSFELPEASADGEGGKGENFNSSNGNQNDSVTPLMVACSKGHLSFLNYLCQNYAQHDGNIMLANSQVVGDVFHPSTIDGNNQAVHYAASFPQALDFLCRIFISQQSASGIKEKYPTSSLSQDQAYFELLSQVNDHGDTVFMMAAAAGDKSAIQYWSQRSVSSSPSSFAASKLQDILAMKNIANDSALSLAYGNGNNEVVEYLVSTGDECNREKSEEYDSSLKLPLVTVTYEDIQRVKAILTKTQSIVRRVPNDKKDEFTRKQRNTQQCLTLLQNASSKLADQVLHSLLQEDASVSVASKPEIKKQKQKHKSKRVKSASSSFKYKSESTDSGVRGTPSDAATRWIEKNKNEDNEELITKPKVFTMEDGTIVSDYRHAIEKDHEQSISLAPMIPKEEKSIQNLLRERCDDTLAQKSEEVMESLCLDASMLLLSPHALAMKLSPSQLEAVEEVLKNQLDAVAQAKEIHKRLLNKNNEL